MYRIYDDVTAELIDGCYILLKGNGDVATLNETASFIWENLDKDMERQTDLFAAKYGIECEDAVADISRLVSEFLKYGLITHNEEF